MEDMSDKLIPTSLIYEFSDDELDGLLKICRELQKASPIDIDIKKGEVHMDGTAKPSSNS
jgi:hypothetical protein